jgi:hypothetical protein
MPNRFYGHLKLFHFFFPKAQKVNLKIKTINFEVFSRTKTLNYYTTDSNLIYNAAKFLLINEINNSNNNIKLRLIGVRVSALREINKNKKSNTIEKFFSNKIENSPDEVDDDDDIDYKNDLFIKCPICNELFEGNQEFIDQHIEFCMFR